MRRMKALTAIGVLAGTLIVGLAVAHGSWWWNSTVDLEGTEVRTIWEVTDDPDNAYLYSANVEIARPKGASASITGVASNETVTLKTSKKLKCTTDGIQVQVKGTVNALSGAPGNNATFTITADGDVVGTKSGKVGKSIKQMVLIPGSC